MMLAVLSLNPPVEALEQGRSLCQLVRKYEPDLPVGKLGARLAGLLPGRGRECCVGLLFSALR